MTILKQLGELEREIEELLGRRRIREWMGGSKVVVLQD